MQAMVVKILVGQPLMAIKEKDIALDIVLKVGNNLEAVPGDFCYLYAQEPMFF